MIVHSRNGFLWFAAAIMVGFTFYAPKLFFHIKDTQLLTQSHTREVITYHLDSDAQDIYLVKLIHSIYHSSYSDSLVIEYDINESGDGETLSNIGAQLNGLASAGILTEPFAQWYSSWNDDGAFLISTESEADNLYRLVEHVTSNQVSVRYKIETKTEKIVDLQIITTNSPSISNADRKEIMERFIQYLGLDILEDWQYNGNSYHSEKSKLRVDLEFTNNSFSLQILPIDYTSLTGDVFLN